MYLNNINATSNTRACAMIIPIKCFTCGNVLANKYRLYKDTVKTINEAAAGGKRMNPEKVTYLTANGDKSKTTDGRVLDELGIKKLCCRRHMLTHVDIE